MKIADVLWHRESKMNRYAWLPTESAHALYPMEIIKGDLIFADGTSIYIPNGRVFNNGWGNYGSTHIIGEELKPLPVKLSALWLSYAEDKFYEGHFSLPAGQLAITFKRGFLDPFTGKKDTFDSIIVGFAPRGRLSIWVGGASNVTEIALFQAPEANPRWEAMFGPNVDRNSLVQLGLAESLNPEARENIRTHGLRLTQWNRYHERFNWKPDICGVKTLSLWATMNNGERRFYPSAKAIQDAGDRLAVPRDFRVEWESPLWGRHTTIVALSEAETYAAFDQLTEDDLSLPLHLTIEIGPTLDTTAVYLRSAQSRLRLEKAVSKIYRS